MFSAGVLDQIGHYVYRLIDPQTGKTFYVGKGRGQRVFSHLNLRIAEANAAGTEIDAESGRVAEIQRLRSLNLEPEICIHRHGMTDDTAIAVELALIDAYDGLSNLVGGHGSSVYGPQSPQDLEEKYGLRATPLNKDRRYLFVFLNKNWRKGMKPDEIYKAAQYAWGVNRAQAAKCQYVLAVSQGVVRGCFIADQWLEATVENFPERSGEPKRSGFIGRPAPANVWDEYVPTRMPAEAMPKGKGPTSFCYWPRQT